MIRYLQEALVRRRYRAKFSKQESSLERYRYSDDERFLMLPMKEPSGLFARKRYRYAIYFASFLSEALLLVFTMPPVYWIYTCSWPLGVFFSLLCVPLVWLRVPYFKQIARVKCRHSNVWHARQTRRVLMALASHTNLVLSVISGCIVLGFFDSNNYPPRCVTQLYAQEDINAAGARFQFIFCGLSASSLSASDGAHYFVLARCRFYLFAQSLMLAMVTLALTCAYMLHSERSRIVLHRSVHAQAQRARDRMSAAASYLRSDRSTDDLFATAELEKQPLTPLQVTFVDDDYDNSASEEIASVETENEAEGGGGGGNHSKRPAGGPFVSPKRDGETLRTSYKLAEMEISERSESSSDGEPAGARPASLHRQPRPPQDYYNSVQYSVLPNMQSLVPVNEY